MDSLDLYHTRQQYALGSYKPLIAAELPDKFSPDYLPSLLYKARAQISSDPSAALASLPKDDSTYPVRAIRSLATYFNAKSAGHGEQKDKALDDLRDLCIEIEGEDLSDDIKGTVRVVAAVAFVKEGELEEAQETLQGDGTTKNLEATALTVQLHLSVNRIDLATKEYEKAKKWADDDTLLQLIEASIDLLKGTNNYSNPHSFYTEQSHNPSLTSAHLVAARGITRLMRGELKEAGTDLSEALRLDPNEIDACAASVALSWISGRADTEEVYSSLKEKAPLHPLIADLEEKGALFDNAMAKYQVPPPAVPA